VSLTWARVATGGGRVRGRGGDAPRAAAGAGGVSYSHVSLMLREWCEEGRLVRVARGRYALAGAD